MCVGVQVCVCVCVRVRARACLAPIVEACLTSLSDICTPAAIVHP